MDKIKDLMMQAAKGSGLPEKINYKTGGLLLKYLISGRLLIPLAVMITNINHYRAFGRQLIYIDGGVTADPKMPFGIEIIGDIDLNQTDYPIGYILIALTSTFHELKPYILNQRIDEISLSWKAEIKKITKKQNELQLIDYVNLPPLRQM